ncbi:MAG: excinuclease ABC subunit UvrA [Deltaproteobacteria bacterium]|nr:MAG: excinuclease ABC subunit UvrA [Deltaproteobacteria bacterium]
MTVGGPGRPGGIPAGRQSIVVRGAREHNLKSVDVEIPRDRLVVITGLSGSGKSSLAFDTLYAEGQRRYVESLSAYARQFLEQMEKPDCDAIEGLSPAIAIEAKGTGRNPRSTVGTVTEIADYLRLLYARVGRPLCYSCGREIAAQTVQQVVDRLTALPADTRLFVYAPVVRDRKGEHRRELDELRRGGFVRVRVDGALRELAEDIALARTVRHTIEVLVDRLIVRAGVATRLADSLAVAFRHGDGTALVEVVEPGATAPRPLFFSERHACPTCGVSYPELAPRFFSFNSPHGACPACGGLGVERRFDPALIVPRPQAPLPDALSSVVLRALPRLEAVLAGLAAQYRFRPGTPFKDLPATVRTVLLEGSGEQEVEFEHGGRTVRRPFAGLLALCRRRQQETRSAWLREDLEGLVSDRRCTACEGTRLRREARFVRVGGRSIVEVAALPIGDALAFFRGLDLSPTEREIARPIVKEILARLGFLIDVGLDYLALDRGAATLSGGEGQRIRLATQIGSKLVGVLYILDEPSIGLHQRDNARLLATLRQLRDLGNTVVVVEHDRDTILAADHVIDMGPGAGVHGGRVVAAGPPAAIMADPASLTGRYLAGAEEVPVPRPRRRGSGWTIGVRGARANNLCGIDVDVPLGTMTCVTGVSGSGKSSLVVDTIYPALAQRLGGGRQEPGAYDQLSGWQMLDKVIEIDQAPIGRSPRSNPATYTGVFGPVRELFAQLPEARARGYGPGRFSFNVKGGRCEACAGDGLIAIEMHFLPDVFVTCEVCGGRRYNRETLEVHFKGRSIADVLDLSVAEALDFLGAVPAVRQRLEALREVGLEYIRLGQPATTLSGGEAQRVKLARELARRATGRTLYVLDEPTTGLHFDDVRRLLQVLGRLVDAGNTVLLIEHNLDVVKSADYVIDLGPEGGAQGGHVVAAGTPEEIAASPASHTGAFLREVLRPDSTGLRPALSEQRL